VSRVAASDDYSFLAFSIFFGSGKSGRMTVYVSLEI
jgi:hypothetical protein